MAIFINKGDAPLTDAQINRRTQAVIDRDWPQWKRERSIRKQDGEFNAYMDQVEIDTDTNRETNVFNTQLADYHEATQRLAKYRLADGRPEITEQRETGEYDPETGEPITETVVVSEAIEPLVAEVEQPVYDEEGNQTGTEMVPNPLIVADDAERADAQEIINVTPQTVVDYYNAHLVEQV